jgi:hypothetical protein
MSSTWFLLSPYERFRVSTHFGLASKKFFAELIDPDNSTRVIISREEGKNLINKNVY